MRKLLFWKKRTNKNKLLQLEIEKMVQLRIDQDSKNAVQIIKNKLCSECPNMEVFCAIEPCNFAEFIVEMLINLWERERISKN